MNIRINAQVSIFFFATMLCVGSRAFGDVNAALATATMATEAAEVLNRISPGQNVELHDVSLEGVAAPVTLALERFQVFGPKARITVHHRLREDTLKPPGSAYFRGAIEGAPDSLAVVSADTTGGIRGIVQSAERIWVLGAGHQATTSVKSQYLASRELQSNRVTDGDRPFECGVDQLPPLPARARSVFPIAAAAPLPPGEAYEVPIAIETDAEFYDRLGSSSAAIAYIGDLFAYASTLYFQEAAAEFSVDTVSLWADGANSDPWNHPDTKTGLTSFQNYWNANRRDTRRAIAHFLSGKNLGGGVAYIGVLCDENNGYGYSANISGSFSIDNPHTVWDILVVTHEIGHNFDSWHTHDYQGVDGESQPVDNCPGGALPGLSSLAGGIAGTGTGTIMSYCHLIPPYYSNISMTFGLNHPYGVKAYRVSDLIRNYVAQVAASNPSCIGASSSQKYSLTVTTTGNGSVASSPAGISCGTGCSTSFRDGTSVTLTASPAQGFQLAAWGGDCTGQSGATCAVKMTDNRNVTATFKAASTVVLSASTTASKYGDDVTFTAAVNGTAPAGTVTLRDGPTTLGSTPLIDGKATLAVSSLSVGTHTVIAAYSGDDNYAPGTSSGLGVTIGKRGSVTALAASPAAPQYGDAVTLAATVSGKSPSGQVTFKDGTTVIGNGTLADGQAVIVTASLAIGSHSVSAAYAGDANHTSSTGAISGLSIGKRASTTALDVSASTPTYGQRVTFTATVEGRSPTGQVSFKEGATTLGTVPVRGGQALFSTSALAVGNHMIAAVYSGDSKHTGSTTTAGVTVSKAETATTLSTSSTSAVYGTGVTFKAVVRGASPTGTLTFRDGTAELGKAALIQGQASLTSTFAAGEHSITAEYSGDSRNSPSISAAVVATVNKAPSATTLTASPTAPQYGETVTLTASVTGKSPTGNISFADGSTLLGSAAMSNGKATLTAANLPVGMHTIVAAFNGDGNLMASTSSGLSVNVGKRASATRLDVAPAAPAYGEALTLTATVGGQSPSGTVTFRDGATVIGSGLLTGGQAAVVLSNLAIGSHGISATYSGDDHHLPSSSGTTTMTISKLASNTELDVSSPSWKFGEEVLLAVAVSGIAPTGSVAFRDGSTTLGTVQLTDGRAVMATTKLAVGSHRISAGYSGDSRHLGSNSAAADVTVGKTDSSTDLTASATTSPQGARLTLAAKVSGQSPTGAVTFTDGTAVLGIKSLRGSATSLSTGSLAIGSHTITAAYSGDKNHSASSSAALSVLITERGALP